LRIPYGLDRLPRDITLRSVEVGAAPLRLNSEPVPADAMPLATGDHAARVAAATAWLESLCGDYAPLRRRFIGAYFRAISARIEQHRHELMERLQPYDGLYAPEDFLWSALWPLPRGWVPADDRFLPADFVFWDGTRPIAIELSPRETDKERALLQAGVTTCRIGPEDILCFDFMPLAAQTLPASPFRRTIPPPGW
jgi:hypothetical protein